MKELLDDKYCLSEGTTSLDKEAICLLLSSSSLLNQLFTMLSRHIFQFPINKGNHLIPLCRGLPSQVYPSVLELTSIYLHHPLLVYSYLFVPDTLVVDVIRHHLFKFCLTKRLPKWMAVFILKPHTWGKFFKVLNPNNLFSKKAQH